MSESEEKPATESKKATDCDGSNEEKQEDKAKPVDKLKKPSAKQAKATAAASKKPVKKENAEQKSEENGDEDKKPVENESDNEKTKNDKKAATPVNEKKVKKSDSAEKEEAEDGEESHESENEEDDDDDEDVPKKKPLLDMPLEVSGSRERKKVERLNIGFNVSKEKSLGEGDGAKLAELPNFDSNLSKWKPADLKPFHKLLFNRPGNSHEIKKNIKSFNGYSFKSFSPEYEKKKALIDKFTLTTLKKMCNLMCLDKAGTKEEIGAKLLDFLMKPEISVANVAKKPTRSTPKKTVEKPKPRQGSRTSGRNRKNKSYAEVSESENEEEMEEEMEEEPEETKPEAEKQNSEEEGEEESEEKLESDEKDDSDDDWDKNKKGKSKPSAKRGPSRGSKKEDGQKTVAKDLSVKEKKTPARSKAKSKKAASEGEEASSDDDEPLSKKSKKPPTDDELKTLIKKILDGANLEEITMKTVCKQVYSFFPEFDLSDRKEFIKDTVRSIIS